MSHRNGMRHLASGMVAACILLLGGGGLAAGQVRVGVGVAIPGLSIGINIPAYPQLAPIPGYPVYYAPGLNANLFFYDGLYWVLAGDDWYYSSWYDGPWYLAEPELVPDFILRVPVLYYRSPPPYFLHWNRAAPPRWGEHWGRAWEQRRRGWDRWNRSAVPPRAPLPGYQRQYPRGRYPGADGQRGLENRYYHYTPRDPRDRARLGQAPQLGQRIAPQPSRPPQQSRPSQDRRRPGALPEGNRAPPAAAQRPRTFTRTTPSPGTERRSPDQSRPDSQSRGRPVQPRNSSGPQGRQEQQREPPRSDAGHKQRPPGG
jgi:hypothetical protein